MSKEYQKELDKMLENISKRKKIPKLLLHVCCAPCSSYVLEYLSSYFEITLYFYNPNIEPMDEFSKRLEELKKLVSTMPLKNKVDIVEEKYNNNEFKDAIRGFEKLGEGSERCNRCFLLRMEASAKYAKKNKYDYFTTTLSISPYKNANKLNEIGEELDKKYNIKYLYADFKKKNGYKRSIELSKEYNLYRQDYCGCGFSYTESIERKRKKEIKENLSKIVTQDTNDIKTNKTDYNSFSVIKVVIIAMFLVFIILIALSSNLSEKIGIINNKDKINVIDSSIFLSSETAKINEYYFYGNHFNIKGIVELDTTELLDANLIFMGSTYEYSYDLKYDFLDNGISFYASTLFNKGLNIDKVNIDKYELFIEIKKGNQILYYPILNNTNYNETTYYSITENGNNKKFFFQSIESKLFLEVTKNEEEVYDVVIDPGHGGDDEGACFNGLCETALTLDLSNMLKQYLEEAGYKVKLTRETDFNLEKYGTDSRVERSYKSKAKLLISVHLNSTVNKYNGFEIYTSTNVDYTLARNFVSALNSVGKLNISDNIGFRVEPGIYTRTFDDYNLVDINKEVAIPYTNISTNTNYYFMIRETGGYMAGAYIDGQAGHGENIFRNSNVGLESYILELGYINNLNDVAIVNENKEEYMNKFGSVIVEYLKK